MSKTKTYLKRVGIGLLAIIVLLGGTGGFYFKSYLPNTVAPKSFPQIDGEIQLEGLDGTVDIYRDSMGIPHIYASTNHDLFFAQGYVTAQDRFWQMDFSRHVGSGSISEMFGEGQLGTDKFLRTLGWKQVAEKEYDLLSPTSKEILLAYTEGVNAYIQDRTPEELSLEYAILGLPILTPDYKIEPWTPVNTLTWGKAMAWDLGGNMDTEIERAILLKTLTPEQLNDLYPPYPADYPVIVPEIGGEVIASNDQYINSAVNSISIASLQNLSENLTLMEEILGPTTSDIGSNSWVVSGELTSTGMPLLANDMHLAIQMPSIWYQTALHCMPVSDACSFEVTGFTFPGVPGVVAGHNNRVAWGFTNLGPDVQDLFIEKVNPDNPNQYEVDGQWVDFETRKEIFNVGGGDPVEITVRITRHGPVISDTYGSVKDEVDPKDPEAVPFKDKSGVELPEQYVIALSWTALTPDSPFESIWGFNRAQNWEEFREAARHWSVPAQNIVFADVDGNIAYQTPGNIPIRKNGDGSVPVPGWNSEYDWVGFIPFDELPYAVNPESGFIATANNQANPREYNYLITKDWDYGQRAARITDMIQNAPGKIDMAYIQSIHGDSKSLNAETLVPILLSVSLDPELASVRDEYFANWNYQETADSKAASVFEWFWKNLANDTFKDELPKAYPPSGGSRWYEVTRIIITQPDNAWWDDKSTTDKMETRDDIFAKAFAETVAEMQKEYGKDLEKLPTWGELHAATFRGQALGKTGISLIDNLFNRGPFITGGGRSIVNATGWSFSKDSFEVTALPSEREIVDLSNLDHSIATHTTGQSGHAYHPHYADMAPLWASVQYAPMWWDQASVINDAEGHLVLSPK